MIELRLLLVKSYHVVHVSKGCVQCAELEVISRLTYLKNNKTLLITCTDWLTLSEGAA